MKFPDVETQPILSIVIPTWNRESEVIRALDSILPLLISGKEVELVVTDNASSDNTVGAVNEWLAMHDADAMVITSDSNDGPVLNWIRGLSAASGYYALLLFSDDLVRFKDPEDPHRFLDQLIKLSKDEVKLIRLPVQIVDNTLQPSPNKNIELSYQYKKNPEHFFELSTSSAFLLNHLLPRRIPLAQLSRSFSPVSPAGYVIQKDSMLASLKLYCDHRNYKQNGAGIDQLTILCAARDSSKVAFMRSPISIMVASPSSITHNSNNSRNASQRLQNAYYTSELDFAKDSFSKTSNPFYLAFLVLSLIRMSKVCILWALRK